MNKTIFKILVLYIILINYSYVFAVDTDVIGYHLDEKTQKNLKTNTTSDHIDLIPINAESVLHLKTTKDSRVSIALSVNLDDQSEITSFPPYRLFQCYFPFSVQHRLAQENMSKINLRSNISKLPQFIHQEVYYNIPTSGYTHACNEPFYKDCTLGFAENSKLTITPSLSQKPNYISVYEGLFTNPISPQYYQHAVLTPLTDPVFGVCLGLTVHYSNLSQNDFQCPFSKIVICPWNHEKTEAAIHGSIHFSEDFSMDLYLKGASVSLFSNENFKFMNIS